MYNFFECNEPYKCNEEYLEDEVNLMNTILYSYFRENSENNSIFLNKQTENILNDMFSTFKTKNELINFITKYKENINTRSVLSLEAEIYIPLIYLSFIFKFDDFQKHCIILSIMNNVNKDYEKFFEYMQYEEGLKAPTFDIAVKLYNIENKITNMVYEFSKNKNNFFDIFFDIDKYNNIVDINLKLKNRIIFFIFEDEMKEYESLYYKLFYYNQKLEDFVYNNEVQEKLCSLMNRYANKNCIVYLYGENGLGKKFSLKHMAKKMCYNILFINFSELYIDDIKQYKDRINSLITESKINQTYICFYDLDDYIYSNKEYYIEMVLNKVLMFCNNIFIITNKKWIYNNEEIDFDYYEIEFTIPNRSERLLIWEKLLLKYNVDKNLSINELANKFIFTPKQIKNAVLQSKHIADINNESLITKDIIYSSCYNQNTNMLKEKTTLIKPLFSWDNLILESEYKEQLYEACNHIKYRHIVYDNWNFESKLAYGKGLTMLFEGASGTGKTMSAQIIANELSLELYKIDLSQTVSKYIGETEKNIKLLFDEGERSNVILFFDETDALFGKRSEVKDSHDKYSNMETSFLLQKIEEYSGIVIMATNYLNNIDSAFIRRINFIIHFPFPDENIREKIWTDVFPKEMPLDNDINFKYLSKQFEISGGNIKNIALSSAFIAASMNEIVSMKHILKAVRSEILKQGKIISKEDFGEYSYIYNEIVYTY